MGLVLEGCTVSAVVPGGPAEIQDENGERIQPKDKLLKIDGVPCTTDSAPEVSAVRPRRAVLIAPLLVVSSDSWGTSCSG